VKRAPNISSFHEGRDQVGESPLWDAERSALWWVDINGKAIRSKDFATGRVVSFGPDAMPGALALAEDDTLIVAAAIGWYRLDTVTGALLPLAAVTTPLPEMRMNDCVIDLVGHFWAGAMRMPAARVPVDTRFALDGTNTVAKVDGLRTQNGCAISPDVGRPDGACVDAEGGYGFAAVDGGRIVRVDPSDKEIAAIDLPVSRPTKPTFGGAELSTIFVTSMSAGLDPAELESEPRAGCVFALEAGIAALPSRASSDHLPGSLPPLAHRREHRSIL
jgi:L-arabinonolactonase